MKPEILSTLKFALALIVVSIFAAKFLGAYQTKVRNEAIDGCYNNSFYRVERIEDGKTITTSETQKYIYDKCLLDKNIK